MDFPPLREKERPWNSSQGHHSSGLIILMVLEGPGCLPVFKDFGAKLNPVFEFGEILKKFVFTLVVVIGFKKPFEIKGKTYYRECKTI